ncbi:hypothetical protein WAF17_03205 [Bernardetia sp. ABR2-2B]|uniref:hypothetical protein n=1 Tax=Bernardetia sp. ABR2-2B TaxID=3127472 RepID=UPI0030CFD92C
MKCLLTLVLLCISLSGFAQEKWILHSYGMDYENMSNVRLMSLFQKYLENDDSVFYMTACLDNCKSYELISPIIRVNDSIIYTYIQEEEFLCGAFYKKVMSCSTDSLNFDIIYGDSLYEDINSSLEKIKFALRSKVIKIIYLGNNIIEFTGFFERLEYYGVCHLEGERLSIDIIPVVAKHYINGSSPKAIVNDFNEQKFFKNRIYLSNDYFRLKKL